MELKSRGLKLIPVLPHLEYKIDLSQSHKQKINGCPQSNIIAYLR